MLTTTRRRFFKRIHYLLVNFVILALLITIWFIISPSHRKVNANLDASKASNDINVIDPDQAKRNISNPFQLKGKYTLAMFTDWNRSLCSVQSDRRGAHQKVVALSIYGSSSKFTDNAMYNWNVSITPFLEALAGEIAILLPSWIIRVYIDFTGCQPSHRKTISSFSNVDVCDMHELPLFDSALFEFLPGKLWRFLPVFDSLVDYTLSRDIDSPMMRREIETLNLWLSNEHQNKFFHIARDHIQHGVPILGGLWGVAPGRSRQTLFDIFIPILQPSIARQYNGSGDQRFLEDYVWSKVKDNALIFDSYFCATLGGQPFLSQRPPGDCYLGCIRPCCTTAIIEDPIRNKTCPLACRPKDHQDWVNC